MINMSDNELRQEILEVLYKQGRRCSTGVKEEFLIEKLEAKIDKNELKIHIDYLDEKGYILIKPAYDGFVTIRNITITEKGIDLVGNPRL
jgi:hypothetical protein